MACCTIVYYFALLIRIMLGPFTYYGVVAVHYGTRLTLLSFITIITCRTVLKTLFIMDFNRMISISEQKVMVIMWMLTSIISLTQLGLEAITRHLVGLHQFPRLCLFIYLGKVSQSKIKSL